MSTLQRPPDLPNAPARIGGGPVLGPFLRHRMELPILGLCGVVTAAGPAVALRVGLGEELPGWAATGLFGLLLPLLAGKVLIRLGFARTLTRGVEVGPDQLPTLYGIHVGLSEAIGLDSPPRLLVVNGQGTVNAFAARCTLRRGFVTLTSDLVDLGYELGDWEPVAFALAHELGHIRAGHVALWRLAIRPIPKLIGLDRWLVRAQEYTADRWAASVTAEPVRSLIVLHSGKRVGGHVDVERYLANVRRGQSGVWVRLANALSGHPVGHRRILAAAEILEQGWGRHGRMC